MPQYLSPGVYVQEVPSAVKAIAGVSTSTPGFIGIVPDKVHLVAKDPANPGQTKYVDFNVGLAAKTPKLITNFTQFANLFGDLVGSDASAATADPTPAVDDGQRQLAHAVYGFFNNGGSRCYVIRVTSDADLGAALKEFAAIDEIALVAAPGKTDGATYDALVSHCANTGDRFAILDGPSTRDDLTDLTKIPANGGVAPKNTDLAAWYFPWIKVFDPATKLLTPSGDGAVAVPPSGHLAGIYARVDTERGVHKAPANEIVRGALGLKYSISKGEQDLLNPKGINCIRLMQGGGIRIWGARTLSSDPSWRYINVRRLFIMVESSIERATQWVVFEPNDHRLWKRVQRTIASFLTLLWRNGALMGTSPEQAFYVKCDDETNPPEVVDAGQLVVEIGLAPVKPAEFVIFRIGQMASGGGVEE